MGIFDGIIDLLGGGITGGSMLTAGASLLSGLMGQEGQRDANQMNYQIAQDNNRFNAEQAEINRSWSAEQAAINRQFQNQMSNTSYRRAVEDLKAAGLNPMLAYSQGGASQPSGAQGQSSAASAAGFHPMQNTMAAGMQSAANAASIQESVTRADVNRAQIDVLSADAKQKLASAGHLDAQRDNIRQEMRSFEKRMEKLGFETKIAGDSSSIRNYEQQYASAMNNFMMKLSEAERDYLVARARHMQRQAELLNLKIPEAVAEAAFWRDPERAALGTQFRYAAPSIDKLFTGSMTRGAEILRDSTQRSSSAQGFSLNDNQGRYYYGR